LIAKIYQEIDGRFLGCQALCLDATQTTLSRLRSVSHVGICR